jgi:Putative peptidoglycan binding domain
MNEVAAEVARPSRDAAVKLADGEVVFQRARKGQSLDVAAGVDAITTALRSWSQSVTLPLEPVLPEVTEKTLGKTVTIDLSHVVAAASRCSADLIPAEELVAVADPLALLLMGCLPARNAKLVA